MSNKTSWDLIKENNFEEACSQLDDEYERFKSAARLRNKVYALLNLNKFEEAILLCGKIREERNGETDTDYIFSGVAYWLLNKYSEAIEMWRDARKAKYTDAAGGVEVELLLLFGAIKKNDQKLEKDALAALKKKVKAKQADNWPGPLAKYILGDITASCLYENVDEQPALRAKELCQAYFYVALGYLNNDKSKYAECLEKCIAVGPDAYVIQEYYLAKAELSG